MRVNRVPDAKNVDAAYLRLSEQLNACGTVTDLFRLASSDQFKADAARLTPEDLKSLRGVYHAKQTDLDGKVKLETFDGQIVQIVGVDWWHSDQYDLDGVSLHIRPEREPTRKYKALTSSAPVVTFINRLREIPTDKAPVRVLLALAPVTDPERAAKGQKRWTVKRLPMPTDTASDGSPF